VDGGILVCPCHEWRFDMATGEMELSREVRLAEFKVVHTQDAIGIEMED
jgi:nitrite reductase/ring-hydroxylating ferredoxin subunit